MLNRGDYWQCAFVIPKGGHATLQERGLDVVPRMTSLPSFRS